MIDMNDLCISISLILAFFSGVLVGLTTEGKMTNELQERLYEALDNVAKLHPEDLEILAYATGINYQSKKEQENAR